MSGRAPLNLTLQLHLLILVLATTAILGKLITLPAAALVNWRTLFAALGAAAWVALVRRRPLWPGKRHAAGLMGIGAVVGLHWTCFFAAVKLANISVCLAGLATLSLFTAFTEPLLEKRRVRPFEVLLGLLGLLGISIVAGTIGREHWLGFLAALGGALLGAIFPVLNRRFVTGGSDPLTMVFWEMVGAFLLTLPLVFLTSGGESPFAWQGLDWLWLLVLAWVCTVFAHGFHIRLLKRLSAYSMNLAFNFEPLYGIAAAVILFGSDEHHGPRFYIGMGVIVLANALHPYLLKKARHETV